MISLPSIKLPPLHPLFSVSAGSAPAVPAQGAVAGLQPHGETSGQRLSGSHCSVLLHSNAGHGCGTHDRNASETESYTYTAHF